jgi:DNA-binding IclR family transcriptional regulator
MIELIAPTRAGDLLAVERARVMAVRVSGIAWASGDLEVGVVAVPAPVQDLRGRTIAGVSVAGIAEQITWRRRSALEDAVRRAARAIGAELAAPQIGSPATL